MILEESVRMFDIPEGYKRTKVGFIPVEWEVTEISEICDVLLSGVDKKSDPDEKPVLLCNYLDVLNNEYISSNLQFMKATAKGSEIEKFTLQKNDVIITKDSETKEDIASSATVIEDLEGVLCGYHLAILRPFKPVDGIYLSKVLSSPNVHKQFVNATNGITRFGLTLPTINGVQVYHPPLPEQHQIAAILSTVDAAIAATDEVIAKTEDLKRGLMQDLLTKGIDDAGRVRSEETHAFCEKQGMRVPVEWEVTKLGSVASSFKNGIYKPEECYGSGYPSIRMYNIEDGFVNTKNAPLLNVSKEELLDYGLKPGDILINRVNSGELVGKNGIVQNNLGPVTFESKNIRVRFKQTEILPEFFAHFGQAHLYYRQVRMMVKAAIAQATINQDDLKRLLIPKPPIQEQRQIDIIILSINADLAAERDHRARLQTLKKGLMQDLLTGRKRVPLDGGEAHGA